jgi:hypothetical protein
MRVVPFLLLAGFALPAFAQTPVWTLESTNAFPSPRWSHTAVVHDDRVWVLGGESSTGLTSEVLVSNDGVTFTSLGNAPWQARRAHASVAFNGRIWVMGGYDTLGIGSVRNDVWSSTDGINWQQEAASAPWAGRGNLAAVVYDNRIWISGGQHFPTSFRDVWSTTDGVVWTQATATAAWPARSAHAVEVFDNRMWILGGLSSGTSLNFDDAWYSTDGATWTEATSAPGWTSRRGHAAAIYSDRIWIMGGGGAGFPTVSRNGAQLGAFNNEFWSSADGATWTQELPPAGWSPRRGHQVVLFDGKLVMLGGLGVGAFGGNLLNDAWVYEAIPIRTRITAHKFYDADMDGLPGDPLLEPPIAGWPIELWDAATNTLVDAGFTDSNGEIEFVVDADYAEYIVVEGMLKPYVNITKSSQTVIADQERIDVYFGNVAVQCHRGHGLGMGFWGASRQASPMYQSAPWDWAQRINELGLVDNGGSVLVLDTMDNARAEAGMREWFRSRGPNNNRARQLSEHMATTVLNVYAGHMSISPGVFVEIGGEMVNIERLFERAADLIRANPVVVRGGNVARQMAELKEIFEDINENVRKVYLAVPAPVQPGAPLPCVNSPPVRARR